MALEFRTWSKWQSTLQMLCFAMLFHPIISLHFRATPPSEQCANAMDDDGDGLIDLNDPDCECDIITPKSLIPNPSFEETDCCPDNRSQLDCASGWIQASEPTTDFIHTCDWLGWPNFPPPTPFPDGQGIMGFRDGRVNPAGGPAQPYWKEYAGACLLSPLEADSSYRFEFDVGFVDNAKSPAINISFFGTSDCKNLPFGVGDQEFGCPTNDATWVRLGDQRVNGGTGNKWVKTAIVVRPDQNINAIAIGPDCRPVTTEVSLYYFFDNLILADLRSFDFKIKQSNHPCSNKHSLQITENPSFSYQWYKDGVALVGEISSELSRMYGAGSYQVRLDDGTQCRVSAGYEFTIPFHSSEVTRTVCENEVFQFGDLTLDKTGVYADTFKSINNCDSVVSLNFIVLGKVSDTVRAQIFQGESYVIGNEKITTSGDHVITLTSTRGCDSLVLLQLSFYNVFVPTAFSPNNDGINDVFKVFGESDLIQSSHFEIYDRWGSKVYSGPLWSGESKEKVAGEGVYVYTLDVIMLDGKSRRFNGDLTLLR